MGVCKNQMKRLVTGEIEGVYITSEFESMDRMDKTLQVWKYDNEKDIISYCTITKSNVDKPYFIKIKNGKDFVDKKYVGESLTDDTKLTLIHREEALGMIEKLKEIKTK